MGKVIKTVFISGLVLWGLISFVTLWFAGKTIQNHLDTIAEMESQEPLSERAVYRLINDYRKKEDIPLLLWDSNLCPLADLRRRQIDQVYSHAQFNNVEADKEFQRRPELARLAENIHINYRGFNNKNLVMDWYGSQGHREAILNPKHTHTCISVDPYSAVQIFASYK